MALLFTWLKTLEKGTVMKRATLFVFAVCTYWMVRVMAAPAPEFIPATVEELQQYESTQISRDITSEVEELGAITDGL